MCVIVCGRGKEVKISDIEKMWAANSHGAGVAWNDGSECMYQKGFMKLKDLKDFIESHKHIFRRAFMIHFRLASIGEQSQELTHPFISSKDCMNELHYRGRANILAHNGHDNEAISKMKTMVIMNKLTLPSGSWSDSRAIAYIAHYCGKNVLELFSGRFAYMTPDKIYVFGDFEQADGFYYSNLYWKRDCKVGYEYSKPLSVYKDWPDTDAPLLDERYYKDNLSD